MNDTFAQFIPLLVMLAVIAGAVYFGYPISVIDLTSQTVDVIQSTIRVL